MTKEEVWEMYGKFFVEYTLNNGWEEMLRCMSPNLLVSNYLFYCSIKPNKTIL